jgi:hypothetical protein
MDYDCLAIDGVTFKPHDAGSNGKHRVSGITLMKQIGASG